MHRLGTPTTARARVNASLCGGVHDGETRTADRQAAHSLTKAARRHALWRRDLMFVPRADRSARRGGHYELWSNNTTRRGRRPPEISRPRLDLQPVFSAAGRRRRFRSPKAAGDRNAIPLYRFPRSPRSMHQELPQIRCAVRKCARSART